MCRIFGKLGGEPIDDIILQSVALSMKHGGPDRQDYRSGSSWTLGTDRLAIQGIIGGNQPFAEYEGLCVAFNGEIYNHKELRNDLRQHGFRFADECDGNVIAPLFLLHGPDCVKYLDGMFAIAIVDSRKTPTLHIFSDPAAIKSVYYQWDGRKTALSFASEVEALALLTQEPLAIRSEKVFDYLSLRAVCGEQTIFENVQTMGPSRYLRYVQGQEPQLTTYRSLVTAQAPSSDLQTAGRELRHLMSNEVIQMTSSDVPACVVTSGGLDSTFVSALAARRINNLHSFHICYKGDWPHDERKYARDAAAQLGSAHHELEIDPDTFPELIQGMSAHIGQPNTGPHSLSLYCLFAGIHDAGFRVALTGEGADEFFAGYERFGAGLAPSDDWIPGYMDKFGPFPAHIRSDILTTEFDDNAHKQPTKIEEFANRILRTTPGVERLDTLQALDQWDRFPYYILRRADHLSMAHAVEMRVPFCQPRIMDFARQLPIGHRLAEGKSKRVVYEAARGLIPDSVMTRPKQPFTLPITAMIRDGSKLFDFIMSTVESSSFRQRGYFQTDKIVDYSQRQASIPNDGVANMLWSVMALEVWQQKIEKLNANLHPRVGQERLHSPVRSRDCSLA